MELREFVRHQLFTAAPYKEIIVTPDYLSPDAIPLPFGLPFTGFAQIMNVAFNRISEVKWVRFGIIGCLCTKQFIKGRRRRIPVTADAVCNGIRVDVHRFGQRVYHCFLRYANPETTRDELIKNKAF